MRRWPAIDMNLLVALDALLAEAHVTRAGKRIGLSQPAMSHALARLREVFDDEILVRSPDGMRPTAWAAAVAPVLREHLEGLHGALFEADDFDPATAVRDFAVAASDYGGAVIAPSLVARLRARAPRMTLRLRAMPPKVPVQELADGALDLVVGTFSALPDDVAHETLFTERFVSMRAADRAGQPLTLEAFAAMGHVLIASPTENPGPVDEALARQDLARHIAVYSPHFLAAPPIVAGSDLVITLPERIARAAAAIYPLVVDEPPVALEPFPVSMIWHPRTARHPALEWLRRQVRAVAAGQE